MRGGQRNRPPSAVGSARQRSAALAMVTTLLAIVAFLIGRAAPSATPDPIQTRAGVPVGVGHSPGGAVAAADDYLASEQASVERDPQRFQALLSQDYAAAIKQSALRDAAADRRRDPGGLRLWATGGQSFTVIGAHRLDWYRGESAQVTAWAGQIFWGPRQAPCQVWALGRIALAWRRERWRISAMTTLPGPAPAPSSLPQAGPADDTSDAFYSQLDGFSPVTYGSPR